VRISFNNIRNSRYFSFRSKRKSSRKTIGFQLFIIFTMIFFSSFLIHVIHTVSFFNNFVIFYSDFLVHIKSTFVSLYLALLNLIFLSLLLLSLLTPSILIFSSVFRLIKVLRYFMIKKNKYLIK